MLRPKLLTPFRFAATLTSMKPPTPQASCVVRAKLALTPGVMTIVEDGDELAQGALSGETYAAADDLRTGEVLYPGDFAGWKQNAEVMFRGSCHTPNGKPLTECPVKITVGAWSKALFVVGRRAWVKSVLGDTPSDPVPFHEMRVGWTTAFGGEKYADNPVGKGLGSDELPNVEAADGRVRARGDRPMPACFAPINPRWPARARRMGKAYDANYQKERAPFYSADFDGTFFHAAPADQQLDGFLRGDERLTLHNLHPEHAVLETRLPGLRPRVFVTDQRGAAREVPLHLDTLFIDGDEGCAYLTWRGLTDSADPELLDLTFALIASEKLDEPLSRAHYLGLLAAFERDPQEIEAAQAKMRAGLAEGLDDIPEPEGVGDAEPSAFTRRLAEQLGDLAPALAKKIDKLVAAGKEKAASAPKVNADGTPGPDAAAAIDEALAKEDDAPTFVTGGKQRQLAAQQIEERVAQMQSVRDDAAKRGAPPEVLAAYDRMLADPRLADARAKAAAFRAPPDSAIVPGADLREANLAEHDLAGRDLRGCDLSGADLSHADLRGAKLVGAKLHGTWLMGAKLDDADLEGADLERAMLTMVVAPRARFVAVRFERAMLSESDLSEADLSKAHGSLVLASKTNFRRARLGRAQLEDWLLSDADFTEAVLTHARLQRCQAAGARFKSADFEGAILNETGFTNANLRGAKLLRVRGSRVVFCGADLRDAEVRRAWLPHVRLPDADARNARFFGSDLRHAILRRCQLDGADLRYANLFGADLGRATLSHATLRHANLYGADLTAAAGEKTDFLHANLVRSTLSR